jgi:hypothetical protein
MFPPVTAISEQVIAQVYIFMNHTFVGLHILIAVTMKGMIYSGCHAFGKNPIKFH